MVPTIRPLPEDIIAETGPPIRSYPMSLLACSWELAAFIQAILGKGWPSELFREHAVSSKGACLVLSTRAWAHGTSGLLYQYLIISDLVFSLIGVNGGYRDKYLAWHVLCCFKCDEIESCVAFRYESSCESFIFVEFEQHISGSIFTLTMTTRILGGRYRLPPPTILDILFSSFVFRLFHQPNTQLTI